jgi:transcriptional regulator with XRE-family HTH domain
MMSGVTGAELRKLRERAGLTQAELAVLAEVSKRQVIRWEMTDSPISKLVALGLKALLSK